MKLFLHVFSLLLLTTSIFASEEDVLEYDDYDFESKIAEHETALVMFYAPWCGHCKRLKPEYAKAAGDLVKNDPPVALIKVDCTEAGKETCSKNSVTGYPTLKIFRNGQFGQDYGGPREANGIVKYMQAQVGPASKELKSVADLEKFLSSAKQTVVVGFFEQETDLKVAFLKVAGKLREKISFAHSTSKDVLNKQGATDAVVLFRPKLLENKFEPSSLTYSGSSDTIGLNDFILENFHGLVGIRKTDNYREFKSPLIIVYYAVDYVKNPKGTNYWRNRVLKVANQYKGQITFAISPSDEFTHELNEYGLEYVATGKPKVGARGANERKYIMKEEFSVENLDQFVSDLLGGKLVPFIKSEPIPEAQSGPVIVAVAKNFDDVVTNNGKDTLIEFYAPWCGHCKKLAPTYDELAEKLKGEDVAIVKMDATSNDVPETYDVRGFPTIYWAPKNSKNSPVRYEGGREVNDFIKYIAKSATEELKGWNRNGDVKSDKTEL